MNGSKLLLFLVTAMIFLGASTAGTLAWGLLQPRIPSGLDVSMRLTRDLTQNSYQLTIHLRFSPQEQIHGSRDRRTHSIRVLGWELELSRPGRLPRAVPELRRTPEAAGGTSIWTHGGEHRQ